MRKKRWFKIMDRVALFYGIKFKGRKDKRKQMRGSYSSRKEILTGLFSGEIRRIAGKLLK